MKSSRKSLKQTSSSIVFSGNEDFQEQNWKLKEDIVRAKERLEQVKENIWIEKERRKKDEKWIDEEDLKLA